MRLVTKTINKISSARFLEARKFPGSAMNSNRIQDDMAAADTKRVEENAEPDAGLGALGALSQPACSLVALVPQGHSPSSAEYVAPIFNRNPAIASPDPCMSRTFTNVGIATSRNVEKVEAMQHPPKWLVASIRTFGIVLGLFVIAFVAARGSYNRCENSGADFMACR